MKYLTLLIYFLLVQAHADVQVAVLSTESTPSKSVVKIKAHNGFDQGIKGARAWVFLMDDEGKVVGQHAQWIIGGDASVPASASSATQAPKPLLPEEEAEYTIVVPHAVGYTGTPTKTKITFSRIILADGTLVNPHKSVKPLDVERTKP